MFVRGKAEYPSPLVARTRKPLPRFSDPQRRNFWRAKMAHARWLKQFPDPMGGTERLGFPLAAADIRIRLFQPPDNGWNAARSRRFSDFLRRTWAADLPKMPRRSDDEDTPEGMGVGEQECHRGCEAAARRSPHGPKQINLV
jgi:hypothetical protein